MQRLIRDRDKQTVFVHERIGGGTLLHHLQNFLMQDATPHEQSLQAGCKTEVEVDTSLLPPRVQTEKDLAPSPITELSSACQDQGEGRAWLVVGGTAHGGLIVRASASLASKQLPLRLEKGAIVEEVDIVDNRLMFRKIDGHGPDGGWVSIQQNGTALIQPLPCVDD